MWSNIKKNTNYFAGISVENFNKNFNNDISLITDYLDSWICYCLLFRDFKRKRLS